MSDDDTIIIRMRRGTLNTTIAILNVQSQLIEIDEDLNRAQKAEIMRAYSYLMDNFTGAIEEHDRKKAQERDT